ncbi:ABC transporter transmembrane domain-containing protein [Sedimentitalea todarodis]|uniref:ABC transporter transmembrane domain-containing protein n=1 Tax=Sedimentitalea todarodis TaxID=1631240 RepID=A0ABU3VCZ3_9RHOB|nr:ABC transporter transmembrane domain-containing protein [Sedimentitalea todarodis]MDU9004032.1 ABC transporter transmembrane domain-containing protein [Sedimentitalea todarodis]
MIQLYSVIWRVSGRRQIVLILLALAVAGLSAVPLSYQKEIINELTNAEISATALFRMCAEMMGVILLSLSLKWLVSYRSGTLGEDIIRLLRIRLYKDSSAPDNANDKTIPKGTLTTTISAEAEELGKFTGGAFSDPVVQLGTLVAVVGYIASSQPGLGIIALAMITPQVIIILATQRKVNEFVAKRVRILRRATNRIVNDDDDGEAEATIEEEFDAIFETRRRMFIWKLSTKFVISALNAVATVAVLVLGGWLVLQGRTDVGTVVAATMGLSRLQAPTSFLIAFYRQASAARVKFELVRELLDAPQDSPRKTG